MQQWKIGLILMGFVILLIIGFWCFPQNEVEYSSTKEQEISTIFVHITGEVNSPGLKEVRYGTRLYEVIEQAGGTTENADITRVNLSSIVLDEQKIVIPAKVLVTEEGQEVENGLININTASKEKLMKLTGVGEGTAKKILQYREENGYFNTIEDLMNVSGIGQSKFNGLKDEITL